MFEEEQSSHQRHVMQKFGEVHAEVKGLSRDPRSHTPHSHIQVHAEVKGLMQKTYETFRTDGDEVQREWTHFVENVDRGVEESLRTTVKRSLQELSRAINGDAKTEVQPEHRSNREGTAPTSPSHSHPRSSHFHRSAGATPLQDLRHSPELEGRIQAVDPRAHPNRERRRQGGDLDGGGDAAAV